MLLRKNKSFVTLLLVLVFLASACRVGSKNYSISDVNADNYTKLLKLDNSHSLTSFVELSDLFEIPMIFFDGKKIGRIENWSISRQQINDGYSVSFLNSRNNNYYALKYANETSDKVTGVTVANMNLDNMRLRNGEMLLQRLLTDKGFTYSKSERRRSNDVIIKEYSDVFLIGDIVRGDNHELIAMHFYTFSRKHSN